LNFSVELSTKMYDMQMYDRERRITKTFMFL